MKLAEYEKKALRWAFYPRMGDNLTYTVLGLCGEAGEAAEKVKKRERDSKGRFTKKTRKEFLKELGDVLWYIAAAAKEVGSSMEEVAKINLTKIGSRARRGTLGGSGDNR